MGHRIGIGLFGKGSTNHLHRPEVLAAFRERGFTVTYLVREDYQPLLSRLEGCDYVFCNVHEETGWRRGVASFCQRVRHIYPAWHKGHRRQFAGLLWTTCRPWTLLLNLSRLLLARYRWGASLAARAEARLHRPHLVRGVDVSSFDLLLLLGIGTVNSELEGSVTVWAEHYGIPVVHCIGNYDSLTSKGFRGILPKRLLVWGPQMVEDAEQLHGIPRDRISVIGSIRYNSIRNSGVLLDRDVFLRSVGLDPARKTIVFAGFVHESQYFEMMEIYKKFLDEGRSWQLVLRLYPNKVLMNSVYIQPLMAWARSLPRVFVSCADPHFKSGSRDREVLQIEEEELWNILCHCDLLVDYYSTIALEGAIFDKSLLRMHYLPQVPRADVRQAVPQAFWNLMHNRRILSYGAVEVAHTREELAAMIEANLARPDRLAAARKKMVERECGPIDGNACERVIEECERMLAGRNNRKR